MSELVNISQAGQQAIPQVTATNDSMVAMAMLGKTAAALALVIAIIWACAYLLKRARNYSDLSSKNLLRIIATKAIGQRERVVVVEFDKTWLVLGVGAGEITKLHEMEAPPGDSAEEKYSNQNEKNFASRLFNIRQQNDL